MGMKLDIQTFGDYTYVPEQATALSGIIATQVQNIVTNFEEMVNSITDLTNEWYGSQAMSIGQAFVDVFNKEQADIIAYITSVPAWAGSVVQNVASLFGGGEGVKFENGVVEVTPCTATFQAAGPGGKVGLTTAEAASRFQTRFQAAADGVSAALKAILEGFVNNPYAAMPQPMQAATNTVTAANAKASNAISAIQVSLASIIGALTSEAEALNRAAVEAAQSMNE